MKKKWIAVIPSGKEQVKSIRHIQSLGLNVVGIDANPNAYGRSACDAFVNSDLNNTDEIVQSLKKQGINPIKFIPVVSDWSIVPAAHLNSIFDIEGLNPNVWAFVSKTHFREFQTQNNLNPPRYWRIRQSDKMPQIHQPVVIKPAFNSGSRGVEIVEESTSESVKAAVAQAMEISKNGEVIIEEFIKGEEYSIDGFLNKGHVETMLISKRELIHQKSATTISSLLPSEFDYGPFKSKVQQLLQAIGINSSPFHIEVIQSGEKLTIIDFAVRGGGASIFDQFYHKATGFDLLKASIETAIFGSHQEAENESFQYGLIRYIPIPKSGEIERLTFDKTLLFDKLIWNQLCEEGEKVTARQDDGSRLGSVLSFSSSKEEMIERSDTFVNSIKCIFKGESNG